MIVAKTIRDWGLQGLVADVNDDASDAVAQFPQFTYSKRSVRRAGEIIAGAMIWTPETEDAIREAFAIANAWRDSHAFPMRSIRVATLQRMRNAGIGGITAARLKRMQAIRRKLRRFNTDLDGLQDLGGCRAILDSVDDIDRLFQIIMKTSDHQIRHKNYIETPKDDGYRGIHLIFTFNGHGERAVFNGRKIELQLRTKLQHSWATAVEAVGLFRGDDLKSHQGDQDWLRLFALMSGEFAEVEHRPVSTCLPSNRRERKDEIRSLASRLQALDVFEGISQGFRGTDIITPNWNPTHYLIRFDNKTKTVHVEPYQRAVTAATSYDTAEASDNASGLDRENVVLVEVDKIDNLKAAYPNYFGDVQLFKSQLRLIVSGKDAVEYAALERQVATPLPRATPDLSWLRGRGRLRPE